MNRPSWLVANFVVFLLFLMLCTALQTSLLHWVFGWRPTIQIAIVVMVYISLYRNAAEALLFVALGCCITSVYSIMLSGVNVFAGLCLFLILRALRTRVYSSSPVYFTWTALSAVLAFHLIAWISSLLVEPRTPPPRPLDWVLEVLITALFTRLIYNVCVWLDKKMGRLSWTELNS